MTQKKEEKKEVKTKQCGECYLALHEDGDNPDRPEDPGKIAIFRGRGSVWMTYGEFLDIRAFVLENADLCERQLQLEKSRMASFKHSFVQKVTEEA